MKLTLFILAILIIGAVGFVAWSPTNPPTSETEEVVISTDNPELNETETIDSRSAPAEGEYAVQSESSMVNWAGKKPLIEGYINSGSISVTTGSLSVGPDTTTGEFVIDMNTLSVDETPTKPGSESTLESHLKGERWFNVETYPEASFEITSITPRADSDTSFLYDIEGELTMKGATDTLAFPATVYQDADGQLHASADFEFDRTKWGITAGSGSFFDNLADNVIDDMVALSFDLVAEQQ